MPDEVESKIAALFEARRAKESAATAEKAVKETAAAKNLDVFQQRRQSDLKPAMLRVAEMLQKQGVRVEVTDESNGGDSPHLTFTIYTDKTGHRNYSEYPHLRLMYSTSSNTVTFHKSTIGPGLGGQSGGDGTVSLEAVTPGELQKRLLHLIEQVYGVK